MPARGHQNGHTVLLEAADLGGGGVGEVVGEAVDDHLGGVVMLEADKMVVGDGGEEGGGLADNSVLGAGHQELTGHLDSIVLHEGAWEGWGPGPGGVGCPLVWAVAPEGTADKIQPQGYGVRLVFCRCSIPVNLSDQADEIIQAAG